MIRPALLADARAIARVHVASWRTTYRGIMPAPFLDALSVDERTARWEKILSRSENGETELNLVACAGGEVVGFAGTGPLRGAIEGQRDLAWELYAIYLLESHQRAGLGRALLGELSSRVGKPLFAWVAAANAACGFYERLGGTAVATKTETVGGAPIAHVGYRLPVLGGSGA